MKFFQKTWVAVILTGVMILTAIGIGMGDEPVQSQPVQPQNTPISTALDTSLDTGSYATWIWDEAGVLSDREEEQICLYLAASRRRTRATKQSTGLFLSELCSSCPFKSLHL